MSPLDKPTGKVTDTVDPGDFGGSSTDGPGSSTGNMTDHMDMDNSGSSDTGGGGCATGPRESAASPPAALGGETAAPDVAREAAGPEGGVGPGLGQGHRAAVGEGGQQHRERSETKRATSTGRSVRHGRSGTNCR